MVEINEDDKKIYNLSIYLLKESVENFEDALKYKTKHIYEIREDLEIDGIICLGNEKTTEPSWLKLLQDGTDEKLPDFTNTSNRALLMIRYDTRVFAIPFGYGKSILKDDVIDRDIALKTALNMINSDSLRSLDRANLDNMGVMTKTQSSAKGRQENFNVDPIRDLLRGVTGGTDEDKKVLGPNVTGSEGISINPYIEFADIIPIIETISAAAESLKYRVKFDWIDNLKQEKDPIVIDALQLELLLDIIQKNTDKIVLTPNAFVDWEFFEGVSFTPKGDIYQDFNIETFYEVNNREITEDWDNFQNLRIHFKYSNSELRENMPLWRCINYETIYNGFLYVFTAGNWYKINEHYATEIKKFAESFLESELNFIDCKSGWTEDVYNARMSDSNEEYHLMDRKLIKTDLIRSETELCDILTQSKELVHVKFYKSSASLSHLFSQGRISSNLLMKDDSFRKNARNKIGKWGIDRALIPVKRNDFKRHEYTITFAIIDKKDRSFVNTLPFFSLLNFRLTAEELSNWGYNVRVKKINILDPLLAEPVTP